MTSKVWTNEQQQQLQQLVLKQQPLKGSLEDTNFVFVISKKTKAIIRYSKGGMRENEGCC